MHNLLYKLKCNSQTFLKHINKFHTDNGDKFITFLRIRNTFYGTIENNRFYNNFRDDTHNLLFSGSPWELFNYVSTHK